MSAVVLRADTGRLPLAGRTKAPRLPLLHIWQTALDLAGFTLIDVVAWCRVGDNSTAWGSWASPASPNLRGDWEAIIVASKGEWARATPPEHHGLKDDLGDWPQLVSTVWAFAPAARASGGHPAPFPVDPEPANGSRMVSPRHVDKRMQRRASSTLSAAHELGRLSVGVDLSDVYCRRMSAAGHQGAFNLAGVA